jgi:hypothetical protein
MRENAMRIFAVVATAGTLALAGLVHLGPAQARAPHRAKHPPVRTSVVTRHGPHVERPPGYSHGGPLYTTCDRINRDRMLVGTCR